MSKKTEIVVLCEGGTDESFIRSFLKKRGYTHHQIRVLPYPDGSGSGEQFVRERFPKELQEIRKRQNVGLIACTDEDGKGRGLRKQMILDTCNQAGIASRGPLESALILEPARNMEVWYQYLLGETWKENGEYNRLKDSDVAKRCADTLHKYCFEDQKLPEPAPQSLKDACEEWRRMKA